jgi:putative transposase
MSKLHVVGVAAPEQEQLLELPEHVQLSLGEIAGAAKEGLLALAVGTGLAVLNETMEWEVTRLAGVKGRHDAQRIAKRHGHTSGEVTLGGRRVPVSRPRVRRADDTEEIALESYGEFSARDLLGGVMVERMLAGVSTRRYERTAEPVGREVIERSRSTSKSAVSREFIKRTATALGELLSRRLDEVELAVLMLDGIELEERCHVVALGITTDGTKVALGVWEGSTENATVAATLLADLQGRALCLDHPILCVLDGAKALAKAVRAVVGNRTPIQRCVRHKERNVCDQLPEAERPWVRAKLRAAWAEDDHARALSALKALAASVERAHPCAATSLREGMHDTLTLTRLGVTGSLKSALQSTNSIESMFDTVRRTQRNVKRWQPGDMRLRWTAAGILQAERQFRRVKGHRDMPKLTAAIHHELHPTTTTEEANILIAA